VPNEGEKGAWTRSQERHAEVNTVSLKRVCFGVGKGEKLVMGGGRKEVLRLTVRNSHAYDTKHP